MNHPKILNRAAAEGDLSYVKFLLKYGSSVNATDDQGHFALGGAIIDQQNHIVSFLIMKGANINQKSVYGWSPLYIAVWANNLEGVNILIAAGACLNTKTIDGPHSPKRYTPLHLAAIRGKLGMVKLLVKAGAIINARDGNGCTPLDLAKEQNKYRVAKYLVMKGGKACYCD